MSDLFEPDNQETETMGHALERADAPANLPTVHEEAAELVSMIERAASNPAVDVDKFERLVALRERMADREAERTFDEAMNAAQAEMDPVRKNASNSQTSSKYATFGALDAAVRPIYSKHGFSLIYGTAEGAPTDHVRVTCRVAHRAGHRSLVHIDMPCDGKGAKGGDVMTKTHAMGAAMTYGQRYLLKLIFNIAVAGDDDGNGASARDQSAAATKAIEAVNACNTLAELREWKAKQWEGVSKLLSAPEADRVIRLVNERTAKLKAPAEPEVSDFPGDRAR